MSGQPSLKEQVEEFERKVIVHALKENQGNQVATAEYLGMSRRNLLYKIKRYGIRTIKKVTVDIDFE